MDLLDLLDLQDPRVIEALQDQVGQEVFKACQVPLGRLVSLEKMEKQVCQVSLGLWESKGNKVPEVFLERGELLAAQAHKETGVILDQQALMALR